MKSLLPITLVSVAVVFSGSKQAFAEQSSRTTTSSQSDPEREARAHKLVQSGIDAYKKRDYVTARYAFLEAYELGVMLSTAAMLADTEMKLQRYRDAAEHWSAYLRQLAPDQTKERADVTGQLEDCRKHLASIRLILSPKDAVVLVDGIRVDSQTTDAELWLEPGAYSVRAVSEDRSSARQDVVVQAGDMLELPLYVPPSPALPHSSPTLSGPRRVPQKLAPKSPPPPAHSGVEARTVVLIGESILTLAAAAISTGYLIQNKLAYQDAKAARAVALSQAEKDGVAAKWACPPANAPDACNVMVAKTDEMGRASDISTYAAVTAGVLGVATVATYLLWPTSKATRTSRNELLLAPWWSSSGKGLAAQIGF